MRPIHTCTRGHDVRSFVISWNGPISTATAPPIVCAQPASAVAEEAALDVGAAEAPTSMNITALPAANSAPSNSRTQPTRFQLRLAAGTVQRRLADSVRLHASARIRSTAGLVRPILAGCRGSYQQ